MPADSVSASDGAEIRPLTERDLAMARDLFRHSDNAVFAGSLDVESRDLLATLQVQPWVTPMLLLQDGKVAGVALVVAADMQNRHGRLVVLSADPRLCATALALYLRHVFWSHPVNRLYTILPAGFPQAPSYINLLTGCGFVKEGRLLGHLQLNGRTLDLDVFGLLRSDFDTWAATQGQAWRL
jgi:hypothetical protein